MNGALEIVGGWFPFVGRGLTGDEVGAQDCARVGDVVVGFGDVGDPAEGVEFGERGRIYLKKYGWKGLGGGNEVEQKTLF